MHFKVYPRVMCYHLWVDRLSLYAPDEGLRVLYFLPGQICPPGDVIALRSVPKKIGEGDDVSLCSDVAAYQRCISIWLG